MTFIGEPLERNEAWESNTQFPTLGNSDQVPCEEQATKFNLCAVLARTSQARLTDSHPFNPTAHVSI
jgi:hypothetical protein